MAEARKGADKHRLPKRGHRHGILALLLLALGCAERGAVTIEEPPGAVQVLPQGLLHVSVQQAPDEMVQV